MHSAGASLTPIVRAAAPADRSAARVVAPPRRAPHVAPAVIVITRSFTPPPIARIVPAALPSVTRMWSSRTARSLAIPQAAFARACVHSYLHAAARRQPYSRRSAVPAPHRALLLARRATRRRRTCRSCVQPASVSRCGCRSSMSANETIAVAAGQQTTQTDRAATITASRCVDTRAMFI